MHGPMDVSIENGDIVNIERIPGAEPENVVRNLFGDIIPDYTREMRSVIRITMDVSLENGDIVNIERIPGAEPENVVPVLETTRSTSN